jgi:hypothetical protein
LRYYCSTVPWYASSNNDSQNRITIFVPKDDGTVCGRVQTTEAGTTTSAGLLTKSSWRQVPAPKLWCRRDHFWEDVMARHIQELLLLPCMGGFIAGVTYAATLLH